MDLKEKMSKQEKKWYEVERTELVVAMEKQGIHFKTPDGDIDYSVYLSIDELYNFFAMSDENINEYLKENNGVYGELNEFLRYSFKKFENHWDNGDFGEIEELEKVYSLYVYFGTLVYIAETKKR